MFFNLEPIQESMKKGFIGLVLAFLVITGQTIALESDLDKITAYDSFGRFLWEVSNDSKVISWTLKDSRLYVFSKDRFFEETYLSCINPSTGLVIWQRP